ncbi:sensor histidine kinase [Paenibacillus sp. 2TAB23]|uniref:sensor histidine kinase n=1 Tax=Paenibacillus sp. 2TAB23 TaxID=3233004 RepID=UPI003F95F5D8
MSFPNYLKDKRYFIMLYAALMLFVSLILAISIPSRSALSNVVYVNAVCFVIAALYIVIGFYYRKLFLKELTAVIEQGGDSIAAAMPLPQNAEQAQYLQLIGKLQREHAEQMQQLVNEKRDHQDFIMSWIHEVKLPIAASRLLISNSGDKSVDYMVDKFEDELGKIDGCVEQALYYSRIDSFSRDYFITEVHLAQMMKDCVKKHAKLFINKHIRFEMEQAGFEVQSDGKWLAFIIDQVTSNSLKYTKEGGKIAVTFEEDSKEKRMLIVDTGIGISTEDIGRVFEKGFTGANGRAQTKSTGMGLYLAKQLALKLGHDLSVQSEEERFTRLIIHFPKIRNYGEWYSSKG